MEPSGQLSLQVIGDTPLLPDAIDLAVETQGAATWIEYPVSTKDYSRGYRKITYHELSDAISNATSFIVETYGRGNSFETLAYCGLNDPRYPVFIVAALKAGYKLLLPSPRNSADAHRNLFDKSNCRKLIASQIIQGSGLQQVVDELDIQLATPPSLESILTPNQDASNSSTDEGRRRFSGTGSDPLVVLQTSGTTGHPKPIVIPQAFAIVWSRMTAFEPESGVSQVNFLHGRRLFCVLPYFHAVGVYFSLVSTVYRSTVFIQAPTQTVPTAEVLCDALEVNKFESAFVPPSLVEELSKDATLLAKASGALQSIIYTGGDLPQWAGDIVAAKVHLFPIYGTTEVGHGPQVEPEEKGREDWGHLSWDEQKWGAKFLHHSDDLYELVFERTELSEKYQAGFTIFSDEQSFRTKDLFSKHPSLPGLWKYRGRSDDTVVFATGEKFNPVPYEGAISSHPDVRAALIIGNKRLQTALLIELKHPTKEPDQHLLQKLWPTIEDVNHTLPNFAHILKSHVIFSEPDRPLVRAGKGTVIRRLSLELYADEIDDLYARFDPSSTSQSLSSDRTLLELEGISAIKGHLKTVVLKITGWEQLGDADDFFINGMTSLQAIQLRWHLGVVSNVPINFIYQNSTLDLLAQGLHSLLNSSKENGSAPLPDAVQKPDLDQLFHTYKTRLGHFEPSEPSDGRRTTPKDKKINVVLTGSTGTIGTHILRSLLSMQGIGRIYCLCRGSQGRDRQKSSLARHQLSDTLTDQVSFLQADLAAENLGLSADQYDLLASEVDVIIHNAWKVNFIQSLRSFDDSLDGVINLLNLARTASPACKFLFISSVSAVQNFTPNTSVPERIITDKTVCAENGYGQSKWLAERIVDYAASEYGTPTAVARLGQITGPSALHGVWSSSEWFPSLVTTSKHLGRLPTSLPLSDHQSSDSLMSWIPVDFAASMLAKYALQDFGSIGASSERTAHVIHIANPHQSRWSECLSAVKLQLDKTPTKPDQVEDKPMEVVPYSNWLDALRGISVNQADAENVDDIYDRYPALKLLTFFEEGAQSTPLPVFALEDSTKSIPELGNVNAIDGQFLAEWARKWLGS